MEVEKEFAEFERLVTRVLEGLTSENTSLCSRYDAVEGDIVNIKKRLDLLMRELVSLRADMERLSNGE